MPSMRERMSAYRRRVEYANAAYLAGRTDDRALDNCFEMDDGEFVVVALMRRAENSPALMAALRRDFSLTPACEWSWPKTAARHKHVPSHKLAELAALVQAEAEWQTANIFMPQLAAMNEDGAIEFQVIRKEGPAELTEKIHGPCLRSVMALVQSWTERTIMGVPYHSMLAEIEIRTPEGEVHSL